jgi:hypothetical protein
VPEEQQPHQNETQPGATAATVRQPAAAAAAPAPAPAAAPRSRFAARAAAAAASNPSPTSTAPTLMLPIPGILLQVVERTIFKPFRPPPAPPPHSPFPASRTHFPFFSGDVIDPIRLPVPAPSRQLPPASHRAAAGAASLALRDLSSSASAPAAATRPRAAMAPPPLLVQQVQFLWGFIKEDRWPLAL